MSRRPDISRRDFMSGAAAIACGGVALAYGAAHAVQYLNPPPRRRKRETFLAFVDQVPEGEGTLLDHSLILLGSGLSSGKDHVQTDLPTVIAGSAGGRIQTGRHVRYREGTPISNLWLSIAQLNGVRIDRHGDSNGPLADFRV